MVAARQAGLSTCLALLKPQTWNDHGRLFDPAADLPEGWTHASYPTPVNLGSGRVRVFFTARDANQRGHLFRTDFRLDGCSFERDGPVSGPLLLPGARGEFDYSGVSATCFIEREDGILCYYLGWSNRTETPFQNYIGLACAQNWDAPFTRIGRVPIIDRSEIDPLTVGYPTVFQTDDGIWQMLYGSHHRWGDDWLEMLHVLHRATSQNGYHWAATPGIAVDVTGPEAPEEFAVSKPTVLRAEGRWHLWYARRYSEYILGYATSEDGIKWTRMDDLVQLRPNPKSDFASDAITYPSIVTVDDRILMFYNGNRYGVTGFGCVELMD